MKIGIISDIHGNYEALTTVVDALKKADVDMIVNAGDNVGYSPFPDECIGLLEKEDVAGVMGNYDEAVGFDLPSCGCGDTCEAIERVRQASLKWTRGHVSDATREYLRGLPHYRLMGTDFGNVMVMHGGLYRINEHIFERDDEKLADMAKRTRAALVVTGHTHLPFSRTVDGTVFVNPGSVGKPIDNDPRASYAIADVDDNVRVSLFRIDYPVEHNVRALGEAGLPEIIGEMLRAGRSDTLA